jgi:glycosyltransferase involved in cell wall biosynthesis
MKILYVTPDFQHPTVPGSHRHYHFIKDLSKRHTITLFTLASKQVPVAAMQEMASYAQDIRIFDVTQGPKSSALAKSLYRAQIIRKMKREFQETAARGAFDVVLFHGKILYSLLDGVTLPTVIDFCDATAARFRTQISFEKTAKVPRRYFQLLRARHRERKLLASATKIAFISARDRAATVGASPSSAIIPNAVDPDFWNPRGDRREPNTLALTGVMNYRPNEDAAQALIHEIMPGLRTRLREPNLLIIGRAPTSQIVNAAKPLTDVVVTGEVDDVRPWMERAQVFVAPIQFASGMQNKVLEAMAMELPVVTTTVVAEGIEIDGPGSAPVIVADNNREFIDAVVELLNDPERRREMGKAGREYVTQHFSWLSSAAKFESLCFEAIGRPA